MLAFMLLVVLAGGESDSAEIRELLAIQAAAWNHGDIAGYMEGYWKSDSLLFTSGGTLNRGWQSTLDKYEEKYDTRERMGFLTFSNIELNILSETSAWVLGRWELQRTADTVGGVFTLVLRKFPEGWRIVHDHTSVKEQSSIKKYK
jgi:beta-aspartyl-peptidase (threonine type)